MCHSLHVALLVECPSHGPDFSRLKKLKPKLWRDHQGGSILAIVNTTDQDQSSVKLLVNLKWLF